jgi:hypothetical protein
MNYLTWLGLLNFLVLQWFFIRLGRIIDIDSGNTIGWTLIRWPLPLTGWWSDFRYLRKCYERKRT